MKFQLITEQPSWWIILCILLGLGYAFLLYRNDKSLDSFSPWLKRLLFAFRTITVSILAFLLLTPLIKTFSRESEKPILILAQDNSESVRLNRDSSYMRETYPGQMKEFISSLSDKYDVKTVSWGDRVTDQLDYRFSDKLTDFSTLFQELNIRYGNRNVGAVVIASDGLYNRGNNPLYQNSDLKVPIYTVALGDTSIQKDLILSKVNYNKVVYLGNSFPLEITVDARQCSGKQTLLTVSRDSSVLFSRQLTLNGNRFSQVVPVILDAKAKGTMHYRIAVTGIEGEVTLANNVRDIFIDVLESKQKIYLVADAPHPDLGAMKLAIESSENYEVKTTMSDAANDALKDYNLLILHNLPSATHNVNDLLKKAEAAGVPVLFIMGTQTDINAFNALKKYLSINTSVDKSNAVQAAVNPDFSLFTISDETREAIPQFPPLLAPFGRFKTTANTYTLLYQQVGNVTTNDPLWIFGGDASAKVGFICGEGLWHWRLSDYQVHGNFSAFNELITKTVQNLSLRENKTHFRLVVKNNFAENDPVTMDAEVYNDNYELINTPDINLTLTSPDKKTTPYVFSKTDRAYTLNAGFLNSGSYKYKATVRVGDKAYTNEGTFTVSALQVEQNETVADHRLLYNLSAKNGGELFYPANLKELSKKLMDRDDIKTVSYSHYKLQDLVTLKIVFALLLLLLTLEWFLRKRSGTY